MGMGVFLETHILEKKAFYTLWMDFIFNLSNESKFLKTQGSRLSVIVAPNKGLM